MYTFKEAIEQIRAAGGDVTYDQLRHWESSGLLEVFEGKSRGGRPPKMLTEEGFGAAISLSNWYRVVRNPEAASILLWLEGFDYVGVDPVKIVQKFRNELYEDLKRKIPALPSFEEIDPVSPLMDRVLREIDQNFTRQGLADLGGLFPLLFGMIPNPGDFEFEQAYNRLFEGELEDPLPSALDMLMATQTDTLKEIPEIRTFMKSGNAISPAMMRDGWLAMVRDNLEEVDWEFVRAFWRVFNLAADVAYELWVTGQVKDDQEAKIVINRCRNIYAKERNCPGSVLMMLVPPSLVIPEEKRREYKQMAILLSQAQKGPPPKP
jgi:hypothetical protein